MTQNVIMIRTSLCVGHARWGDSIRIEDRMVVNTPLGMSRQTVLIEQIALLRNNLLRIPLSLIVASASLVHQFAVFRVFRDVLFFLLVDLF